MFWNKFIEILKTNLFISQNVFNWEAIAAISTLSAVLVSLYLSKRDNKVSLSIVATIKQISSAGVPPEQWQEFLWVTVTNTGPRAIQVQSFFWRVGIFKKNHFVIVPSNNQFNSPLPKELRDGEHADWVLPLSDFQKELPSFFRDFFVGTWAPLTALSLRAGVNTSIGVSRHSRVSKYFRKFLLREYQAFLKNHEKEIRAGR